ncbi:hypothetical protein C8Q78DRAFT_1060059 [Trametes maxima]|nr:hypothetical protein C8Q78DRAFT_1060059 [Trametes maxima]
MSLSRRYSLFSAAFLFFVFFSLGFTLDRSVLVGLITGPAGAQDPPLWHVVNPFVHKGIATEHAPGVHDDKVFGVFSEVLVVSRPGRFDRRATMERLRLGLGVPWTYVDAISHDDPLVKAIMDCVRSVRLSSRSSTFQWPLDWMIDGSVLEASKESYQRYHPTDSSCFPSPPNARPLDFSSIYADSVEVPITGAEIADEMSTVPLTCAEGDRVHGVDFRPSLRPHLLLTPAKVACWYSHVAAIQHIATIAGRSDHTDNIPALHHDAYLILEDDVDVEQTIAGRLADVWNMLPSHWDVVYLGHCWSDESSHAAIAGDGKLSSGIAQVHLHPSFYPKCTHAYALNPASAGRVLQYLLHPPFAYSRALDQALAWLVSSNRLRAFSVVPSLVVQLKNSSSDIDGGAGGVGSYWRDHLEHGVLGL